MTMWNDPENRPQTERNAGLVVAARQFDRGRARHLVEIDGVVHLGALRPRVLGQCDERAAIAAAELAGAYRRVDMAAPVSVNARVACHPYDKS